MVVREHLIKMNSTHTKYENNWKSKSLENLEKDYWEEPTFDSYLAKTCYQLRKRPLKDFRTEDLRIMIGQNIGLKYLIPLALETLKGNVLVKGDFYEGDLLKSVLTSNKEFWCKETSLFNKLQEIILENKTLLNEKDSEFLNDFNELCK